MTKLPYIAWYPADHLADTAHLSAEEHGAYCALLFTMWLHGGSLPNDPKMLTRVARVAPNRWCHVAPNVLAMFVIEGDRVTHKRLKQDYEKANQLSGVRSEIGRRGGRAKARKYNGRAVARASDLPVAKSCPPSPSPDGDDGEDERAEQTWKDFDL